MSRSAHLWREGGPAFLDRQWLTALSDRDLDDAFALARARHAPTVAVVEVGGHAASSMDGYHVTGVTSVALFADEPIVITSFALDSTTDAGR